MSTNMDGTRYNALDGLSQEYCQIPLVLNLVSSLRINIFTKIDLMQWLNEPFTPPPETENHLF